MRVRFWHPLAARADEITAPPRGVCQSLDGWSWPCQHKAEWSLAWTQNESGLPGMGEAHVDFVCGSHLHSRIRLVPFEFAGSVTITPYEEV